MNLIAKALPGSRNKIIVANDIVNARFHSSLQKIHPYLGDGLKLKVQQLPKEPLEP